MRILTDMDALPAFRRPIVTVGSFDGVHRGHHFLLEILRKRAGALRGESIVVTFCDHPRRILGTGDGLRVLTSLEEKARLLKAAEVDNLVVMPFDTDMSQLSAEEFVRDFLVGRLGVQELVVGYNHRVGRNREGDAALLGELGKKYGFDVFCAPKFEGMDAEKISSTAIREAISRGDIELAERMLGRAMGSVGESGTFKR